MSAFRRALGNWYSLEIVPVVLVLGCGVGGASWYLTRLARGPEVVWAKKSNPYPWQNVDQDTNVKLMSVQRDFKKQYVRERW